MKNLSEKESWMDILKTKFKNADAADILLGILLGALVLLVVMLVISFAAFIIMSIF